MPPRRDALPFTEWDAATHSLGCPEIPPRGDLGSDQAQGFPPEKHVQEGHLLRQEGLRSLQDTAELTQPQGIREGFLEEEVFK